MYVRERLIIMKRMMIFITGVTLKYLSKYNWTQNAIAININPNIQIINMDTIEFDNSASYILYIFSRLFYV
jgi:hypothetical protein